jgi:adenylate cyclase class 1
MMEKITQTILTRNKKVFKAYNLFRKRIFAELRPRESEDILYLLPWLLSVNHPACPGYVKTMKTPFRVFNVDNEGEIRRRESSFKRRFQIQKKGPILRHHSDSPVIQGIYTIGSLGTISQTSGSDCDIWLCYNKKEFNKTAWNHLNRKVNLIKDWLDMTHRLPVFFFISDMADIRDSLFGQLGSESSGSTQKNILKEEFYRTCIVICGKIPLWWVCFDKKARFEYEEALSAIKNGRSEAYDLIDFGNLEQVEKSEYFGAALWQLHKSLTHPIKSIIKMILLKIVLEAPEEMLISHQFRAEIMGQKQNQFSDPSVFLIRAIFNYYQGKRRKAMLAFLKECFYLRCRLRPYEKRKTIKNKLANELFQEHPIDIKTRIRLGRFDTWEFNAQVKLGNRLIKLMIQIYREIADAHRSDADSLDKEDLAILGRKIAVCYETKKNKIPILHNPGVAFNLSALMIKLERGTWTVTSRDDKAGHLASSSDLIYNIAFIVWNGLFSPHQIQMKPNASSATIQEILNLGIKMRDFFGTFETTDSEFHDYMRDETIKKLLVIVSFERSPWEKDINDISVVYKSSWGGLYAQRFKSLRSLDSFLKRMNRENHKIEIQHYLERNCAFYEKIIERTKRIVFSSQEKEWN